MRGDLQEIFNRLPKLGPADLAKLKQRVDLLQGVAPTATAEPNDWLLEGITEELRKRGLHTARSIPKDRIPKAYLQNSGSLQQYLLSGWRGEAPRTVEKLALGRLAGVSILDYLGTRKLPLSVNLVMNNTVNLPTALDEAFPGYWENGWLRLCVQGAAGLIGGPQTEAVKRFAKNGA